MKTQQNKNSNQDVNNSQVNHSDRALSFGDMVVYNEMADNTSVKLNLIQQIHSQLNQLEEMNHKRRFLMKEILEVIS